MNRQFLTWLRDNPWFGKDISRTNDYISIATLIRKKTKETGLPFMKIIQSIYEESDFRTFLK